MLLPVDPTSRLQLLSQVTQFASQTALPAGIHNMLYRQLAQGFGTSPVSVLAVFVAFSVSLMSSFSCSRPFTSSVPGTPIWNSRHLLADRRPRHAGVLTGSHQPRRGWQSLHPFTLG